MNIGADIERMVNKEVERRLTEYQRVCALLVEQLGGRAEISQEDMALPTGNWRLKTYASESVEGDRRSVVVIEAQVDR